MVMTLLTVRRIKEDFVLFSKRMSLEGWQGRACGTFLRGNGTEMRLAETKLLINHYPPLSSSRLDESAEVHTLYDVKEIRISLKQVSLADERCNTMSSHGHVEDRLHEFSEKACGLYRRAPIMFRLHISSPKYTWRKV